MVYSITKFSTVLDLILKNNSNNTNYIFTYTRTFTFSITHDIMTRRQERMYNKDAYCVIDLNKFQNAFLRECNFII